jgi:membrane protease YdiL (CAAX protease family)
VSTGGRDPFAKLGDAFLLGLLAWLATQLVGSALLRPLGANLAAGAGLLSGVTLASALAFRALPRPLRQRLGLVVCSWRALAAVALLIPIAFAGSELEQLLRTAWPPPDLDAVARGRRAMLATDTPVRAAQSLAITVVLAPALEEWLFRGLLQPGLVARLGARRGILITSAYFGLWHGVLGLSFAAWLGAAATAFLYGIALGVVRQGSGSLLAAFLLHAGINGSALLGAALTQTLPIPVWNAPGTHVPLGVLLPALLAAALGLALAAREGRVR